jgi:hypothetical protein
MLFRWGNGGSSPYWGAESSILELANISPILLDVLQRFFAYIAPIFFTRRGFELLVTQQPELSRCPTNGMADDPGAIDNRYK